MGVEGCRGIAKMVVALFPNLIRSHLKKRILVQGQGGRNIQTGGASEANALRGKYSSISRIAREVAP